MSHLQTLFVGKRASQDRLDPIKWATLLCQSHRYLLPDIQDRLDPIDWATYEPHLWANVQHYYQRTATLLGLLTQLQRAYPEGTGTAQVRD